jgi:hypothetical protein
MLSTPGYIGFAKNRGVMGKLIRVGEWLKFRKGSGWNHMFVVAEDGNHIIQATLEGVTDTALLTEVAPGGEYVVFAPPPGVRADDVLRFARSQVGTKYGVLTILAIAIDILTWQWVPALRGARKNSWICSGLTCEALRFGGWLYNWIDVYTVTPAQAYEALNL